MTITSFVGTSMLGWLALIAGFAILVGFERVCLLISRSDWRFLVSDRIQYIAACICIFVLMMVALVAIIAGMYPLGLFTLWIFS